MKIRLWGTRGSIPVSSPQMARYGGDTTCVEILADSGDRLILDAGTGIHALGDSMDHEIPADCTICFSHTHWDHIQGLPHFKPLYNANWRLSLLGPAQNDGSTFAQSLLDIFDKKHFPVPWHTLPQRPILEFTPGESFTVGAIAVKTCPTVHPGVCVAYRIEADGWSFVFSGDHECDEKADTPAKERLLDFMADADVALVDGHYLDKDYPLHRGWGHSSFAQAMRSGQARGQTPHLHPLRPFVLRPRTGHNRGATERIFGPAVELPARPPGHVDRQERAAKPKCWKTAWKPLTANSAIFSTVFRISPTPTSCWTAF